MLELNGKYAKAKAYTDNIESSAVAQIIEMLNQPFAEGSTVRIMPDVHAGAGCTIGTTMTIKDKVCPNLVGVDIGCGVLTVPLLDKEIDYSKLDEVIKENIPAGHNIHCSERKTVYPLEKLYCKNHIDLSRAKRSLGTLGGGNHFIELDKDDNGQYYLVIHTGSRNLGKQVAQYYQDLAYKTLEKEAKKMPKELKQKIEKMAKTEEKVYIQEMVEKYKKRKVTFSKALAYLEGENLRQYLNDMFICQAYAMDNRYRIAETILTKAELHSDRATWFDTRHNYIDTVNLILRKGAVEAAEGQLLIIPMNMRDGSLICEGKGNPDWNYSAPHGAGRIMSRGTAKKKVSLSDFVKSMDGIYTTTVNQSTIDESPFVYKDMDEIMSNIKDTVKILKVIKPVYNFKAGE